MPEEEIKFPKTQDSLDKEQKARLLMDFLHRIMMHHAMWFAEVQQQYGREKAFEVTEGSLCQKFRHPAQPPG